MVEVNRIVWGSGLNPYGVYDECYGGAPGPDGVISDTEDKLVLVHPYTVPLIGKQAREDYYNILFRAIHWLCIYKANSLIMFYY